MALLYASDWWIAVTTILSRMCHHPCAITFRLRRRSWDRWTLEFIPPRIQWFEDACLQIRGPEQLVKLAIELCLSIRLTCFIRRPYPKSDVAGKEPALIAAHEKAPHGTQPTRNGEAELFWRRMWAQSRCETDKGHSRVQACFSWRNCILLLIGRGPVALSTRRYSSVGALFLPAPQHLRRFPQARIKSREPLMCLFLPCRSCPNWPSRLCQHCPWGPGYSHGRYAGGFSPPLNRS